MDRASPEEAARRPRQSAARWVGKLAWLAVPLVVVGELGHHLLGRLGQVLAHRFFHILFGAGAVLLFGAYAWIDIRRNGWPSFSWRLRIPQRTEPAARPEA